LFRNIKASLPTTVGTALLLSACQAGNEGSPKADGVSTIIEDTAGRHFDFFASTNEGVRAAVASQTQLAALAALQGTGKSTLSYEINPSNGMTSSLKRISGYLTEASNEAPRVIAQRFAKDHYIELGLTAADVEDMEITDEYTSRVSGTHHVFFRQRHKGIPVHIGQLAMHIMRDGQVALVNNDFVPDLASVAGESLPALDVTQAVDFAAAHLRVQMKERARVMQFKGGIESHTLLQAPELSKTELKAQLMWVPVANSETRLAWNFAVETLDGEHYYDMLVDAEHGETWRRIDWTAGDSYKVYPLPIETPIHTTGDRTVAMDPAIKAASPNGWHTAGTMKRTTMWGNNVHAYEDSDSNNRAPTTEPDCGAAINCDFPMDLKQAPATYKDAAVANLFYLNNMVHDVTYLYGFDEAAGNFQTDNGSKGGKGNDEVQAEAQDGSGTNNANFQTPPDGQKGRMQMYNWTRTTPGRDGDFDAGIVIHEYVHGVSTRQVGGPGTSGCLSGNQQAGEGWSDLYGLIMTAKMGDKGTDKRGVGNYAMGQPTTGAGIRTQPYSMDPMVNTHTYAAVKGKVAPHGVGEVWAQAGWEMYWALVEKHGFSPDLTNPMGGFGNQRALLYINEGLQATKCSPNFINNRDGILVAAKANYNGEDVCTIWKALAAFGIGTDAVATPLNSPTNGFELPAECKSMPPVVTITAGPAENAKVSPDIAVTFSGTAMDPEDGDVSANIKWSSSIDGQLGGGATITFALTPGKHVITATGLDKVGTSASVKRNIEVAGPLTAPP
jgi:extracellular elastinolytic metalloproteinase